MRENDRSERSQNRTDATFSGRNERPQNRTDAKPCLSDVYKMSTQAKRRQTDVRLSGRSMVEMLGVLAIIGVLSVGAMSGYSKAMMKYKLNKQIGQISYILNNMIIEHEKLDRAYSSLNNSGGNMTPSFIKLGLVPEEMVSQNKASLYDIFNNRVYIWSGEDVGRYFRLIINLEQNSMDACFNLYNFAKANSADLWQTLFYKGSENGQSGGYRVYGDKYCTANNTCLKDMTISEMEERCSFCKDGLNGCSFNIVYRLW